MEKLVFEKATEVVNELIKGTNFVPQENNTGVSFFEGKQRLVKIVKSKRGLKMEINLPLSKTMENKLEKGNGILKKISPQEAKEKHLGTMKYLYVDNSEKMVAEIIKDLLITNNYKKKEDFLTN